MRILIPEFILRLIAVVVTLQAGHGAELSKGLSPKDMHLATGSEDRAVKLWRARELMDQSNLEASRKRSEKRHGK